ncbi:carboxypeptidase-like regulatory domain-containing protein [Roseivirga sp.]|uniref:carboxypeptidase-like regulatory domain-containing protein n=1 Tax=Roseivirga sp. TaxID=1964215 RepID=UPI003B8ABC3F
MNKAIYLFLLLLISGMLSAQTKPSFLFKGRVVSKDRLESIPFASVFVVTQNKGTATSPQGNFNFRVYIGDSIRITSVGYADYAVVMTREMAKKDNIVTIELSPKAIDLDDVEVIQLSDDFYLRRKKWDTLKLDLPDNIMQLPLGPGSNEIAPPANTPINFPIASIPIFQEISRNPKQARIIRKMEEAETFLTLRERERLKYFNKDIVKKVTRIDNRVIDEFMEFCQFLDGEIIGKSEYEITQKILKRYKAFLRR